MRAERLTAEVERELVAAWKAGDRRAGDRLVRANQPLLSKIASKYLGRAPYDDLMQEGNLGLLRAMQLFDPTRGVRFMTYATWWARAFMRILWLGFPSVVHVPPQCGARSIVPADDSLDAPLEQGVDDTWLQHLAS